MARRERETLEFLAFARRAIRRAGERVADADEFELAELVELRTALDDAIRVAVYGQRSYGRSWAHIGAALGITRQSAQERFTDRPPAAARQPVGEPLWEDA